jgi:hypothetical protein
MRLHEIDETFYTLHDLKADVTSVWHSVGDQVNKRFLDGYATCTFATKAIVDQLADMYEMNIVDGEYKGEGHWFPVLKVKEGHYIVDLGNNIEFEEQIEPMIVDYNDNNYTSDEVMSPEAYLQFYPQISNF